MVWQTVRTVWNLSPGVKWNLLGDKIRTLLSTSFTLFLLLGKFHVLGPMVSIVWKPWGGTQWVFIRGSFLLISWLVTCTTFLVFSPAQASLLHGNVHCMSCSGHCPFAFCSPWQWTLPTCALFPMTVDNVHLRSVPHDRDTVHLCSVPYDSGHCPPAACSITVDNRLQWCLLLNQAIFLLCRFAKMPVFY